MGSIDGYVFTTKAVKPTTDMRGGGVWRVLEHESRGNKIHFHSFTMKIKTFHEAKRMHTALWHVYNASIP